MRRILTILALVTAFAVFVEAQAPNSSIVLSPANGSTLVFTVGNGVE